MAEYELNPTFTGSLDGKLSASITMIPAPITPPPDPPAMTRKLVEFIDGYQGRIAGNLPDWAHDHWPELMGAIEWLRKTGTGLFRVFRPNGRVQADEML